MTNADRMTAMGPHDPETTGDIPVCGEFKNENVGLTDLNDPCSGWLLAPSVPSHLSSASSGRVANGQAQLVANLSNLTDAIRSGYLGVVKWDEFVGGEVLVRADATVPLDDAQITRLMLECEKLGGRGINRPTFKQVLHMVAKDNPFDSAQEWLLRLPSWDGVQRVERFLPDYLGTASTPYEKAVGCYLWTAMVARILEPGCKADMVPVVVGKQGIGKTTCLACIAPTPDHCGEVCLTDPSSDLVRKVLGKTLVVWEELAGIRGRVDADKVKTFITSPYVELRSRTKTQMDRHLRRFLLIGTSNRKDFLRDATGHRRYLPFDVHSIQLDKVRADKDQLWAEALHFTKLRQAKGEPLVDYEDAERLAVVEHQKYLDQARWVDDESLLSWLNAGNDRFRTEDAFTVVAGHGLPFGRMESLEMVKSLRQIGLEYKPTHVRGSSGKPKRWHQWKRSSDQVAGTT